jgi:hypothetical protein
MPLALSPACSTSSTPSSAEERLGNNVDGYFPEVLAKDLERSSAVFATHNMTAGPPQGGLVVEDVRPGSSSGWPHRSASLPRHGPAGRPLLPIQERNSVISLMDHHANLTDTTSEFDSMSETHYPRGPAAASFSVHEQSIITTATSLTSSSWMPSPKASPAFLPVRENSWIEPDSDEEDDQEMRDAPHEDNLATLTPRPPTPPESDSSTETTPHAQPPTVSNRQHLHRKSYSVSGSSPTPAPRRRGSGRHPEFKSYRSISNSISTTRKVNGKLASSPTIATQRVRSSSLQSPRTHVQPEPSSQSGEILQPRRFEPNPLPSPKPDYDDEADDEDMSTVGDRPSKRHSPTFIRPSPPPSPLPSVQSWLNGNAQSYSVQCAGDELTKAVPLPPNVVENLRVSVTCFPETMLLTSSLTVETIRQYSKKVRQPGNELLSKLAPDPPETSRKSIWKRVVAYKRQSPTIDLSRSQTPMLDFHPQSNSSNPWTVPKPWAPLKNVFGSASDYICDALWAHILAYNYISALVPRTSLQRKLSHGRCSSSNESPNEEIPKKAASLLGLSVSQDMNSSVDRMAKKLGSQIPWRLNKETMVAEQSPRSATYENSMRDIQTGLMSSIMRLIATAKLMAEDGSAAERSVEVETRGVDALFVRSLCEIVRQAEESS